MSHFDVRFKVNENFEVRIPAIDNMMFAELTYIFGQKVGLKEEHQASFTFNFDPIKPDSMKMLKDLGIKENSIINVKTEKPLNYKPENFISMGMNMNNPGRMYMNPNMSNFGNMGMNPFQNMGLQNFWNMNNGSMNENIQIVFNYKNLLQANINTPFSEISKRFCSQSGILNKEPIYYLGSRKIDSTDNQTLRQLNINLLHLEILLFKDKEQVIYDIKLYL